MELKQERTDLKKKIILAAKRLTGSCHRGQSGEIISKFNLDLEQHYADFLNTNEEFEILIESKAEYAEHAIVNDLNLEDYLKGVNEIYLNAQISFKGYSDGVNMIKQEALAKPIVLSIMTLLDRLKFIISLIDESIDSPDLYSPPNISMLTSEKEDMDPIIAQLMDTKEKLLSVQTFEKVSDIVKDVDCLIYSADEKKRIVNSIVARSTLDRMPAVQKIESTSSEFFESTDPVKSALQEVSEEVSGLSKIIKSEVQAMSASPTGATIPSITHSQPMSTSSVISHSMSAAGTLSIDQLHGISTVSTKSSLSSPPLMMSPAVITGISGTHVSPLLPVSTSGITSSQSGLPLHVSQHIGTLPSSMMSPTVHSTPPLASTHYHPGYNVGVSPLLPASINYGIPSSIVSSTLPSSHHPGVSSVYGSVMSSALTLPGLPSSHISYTLPASHHPGLSSIYASGISSASTLAGLPSSHISYTLPASHHPAGLSSIYSSSITSASTLPGVPSSYISSTLPASHHPGLSSIYTPGISSTSVLPGLPSSYGNPAYHNTGIYGMNATSSIPGSFSSGIISPHTSSMLPYVHHPGVPVTRISTPGMPGYHHGYGHMDNNIKMKRMELPTFNGDRKCWPEYKNIWQSIVVPQYPSADALAWQFKHSVTGGEAKKIIKSLWITHPGAYQMMWDRVCKHYDDPSLSIESCIDTLHKIKPVKEYDYRGMVSLVEETESVYFQLLELKQLACLTMRDVDVVNESLPPTVASDWNKVYHTLSPGDKIQPFNIFMMFLNNVRDTVRRLAEKQAPLKRGEQKNEKKSNTNSTETKESKTEEQSGSHNGSGHGEERKKSDIKFFDCAIHQKESIKHKTKDCDAFKKLSMDEKLSALKSVRACFRCFGNHHRKFCKAKDPCNVCGRLNHNSLLCKDTSKSTTEEADTNITHGKSQAESNTTSARCISLYAIVEAVVIGSKNSLNTFCDDGSDTAYITHKAAKKVNAKRLNNISLDVTTMGNVETTYQTCEYKLSVCTQSGKIVEVVAFGMERITGPVSALNENVLKRLFPKYDPSSLQRKSRCVDMLLGANYFGLHPKNEVCQAGDNLSIMRGELGICLQGSHPELYESTQIDTNMVKTIHAVHVNSNHIKISHTEFSRPSVACKISSFIEGEELGTEVTPLCGKCRCGKCPIRGHTYSFQEEQELKIIQHNLCYDEENSRWVTSYPWVIDPVALPNNYGSALGTLRSTEARLKKDEKWAQVYGSQIADMVERKFARKLSATEIDSWTGPVFYISHLAVRNPQSNSTPVRIVFNSSQTYKGVSLNAALAKGPDAYMNALLGLLLRWREHQVAMVGDIRKMYNSVALAEVEQHCHRFLWRDLECSRNPDVYIMTVLCVGDKPAGAIATEAIYKTADRFYDDNPEAAKTLRRGTYVDDLVNSVDSLHDINGAIQLATNIENMLSKGGFTVKCWQFSGVEDVVSDLASKSDGNKLSNKSLLKGKGDKTRVLGVVWNPVEDTLLIPAVLNFSPKRQGIHTGPDLLVGDVPNAIPEILTRRSVLSQVMRIYDPLGILCPFTLLAKVYLRETWLRKLGWDEPLPPDLHEKWLVYFTRMYDMEKLKYDRCMRPSNACGDPWLIVLSDGSDNAYGFVAYIRWQVKSGGFWCRFVLAKCRIAPANKVSTPQMELNGAVLSKRGRKVIEKEVRFNFEKVVQIVDSETILCMINKLSTRFNVYYGVRIGEIQAATEGDVSCWAWLSGKDNISDWLTRGRNPSDLDENSEWWLGPSFLYETMESWGLRFGSQHDDPLPGEKGVPKASHAITKKDNLIEYHRFSSARKLIWTVARMLQVFRQHSLKGGHTDNITPEVLRDAERIIILDVQKDMCDELQKTDKKGRTGGKYALLHPIKREDGVWIVGSRLSYNPMTPEGEPQILLPSRNHVTQLFMMDAHRSSGHRGRDSSLARFRFKYWTPHGTKLAWAVKSKCQLCKLKDHAMLSQQMGDLPECRLKPAPPFTTTMVDLFGPYKIRGEIQKRTSGKAYGIIFTDMVMRAIHIEAAFGYDTDSFLMALSRFVSLRGYPSKLYSDPGSQLVGADRELQEAWHNMEKSVIRKKGADNGMEWIFGPGDSPWHQGAVEALIKGVKRSMQICVGNHRMSASEFLTVCTEVANLVNERPIGVAPGQDATISLLTPNSLLMGRCVAKNPGGWQPESGNLVVRFGIVQSIVHEFWRHWRELYAPTLVWQSKWHSSSRNLQVGDIVLISDKDTLKGDYRLGVVRDVFPDAKGVVRKVALAYKNFKVGDKEYEYTGSPDTLVTRSVQRLSLLVPVVEDTEDVCH